MTDTTASERVEVTAADREAAASCAHSLGKHVLESASRTGHADDSLFVQAFARHRLATQPAPSADVLRAAAIDALAGWRYIRQVHGDLPGVGWDRVETALNAALTPSREQTGEGK